MPVKAARLTVLGLLIVLLPFATNFLHPAFAATSHPPILINGNDAFTSDNGVTGGTGTSSDPYVISDWTISAGNYGIEIANTTAYFTITNVTINCNPTNCLNGVTDGIILLTIENGQVQNSHISTGNQGIRVENSNNFLITGSDVAGQNGVRVVGSDHFQITDNLVTSNNGYVIFLYMTSSFDISNNNFGESGAFEIKGSYLSDASIVGNSAGRIEDGIVLDNFSGLLISQNSIRGHVSISLQNCSDSTVDSNIANAVDTGVSVVDCGNLLVSNNNASTPNPITATGEGQGILVAQSTGITVTSNTVSYNNHGIQLSNNATGNSITNNVISNNNCGIATDSSSSVDQNYVADNTFAENTQDYCSI